MTRPTDHELMLFADGELDEARSAEIEAFMLRDAPMRAKLSSLHFVGALVREQTSSFDASPADGIADALMAQIAAEDATGKSAKMGADVIRFPVEGRAANDTQRASPAQPRKRANDSARTIYLLAAAAVAAAAGMVLWSQADSALPVARPIAALIEAAPQAVLDTAKPVLDAPTPDADVEAGVEVAAVDFGSRTGAIFYVPGEGVASRATTTVVWVNDPGEE